MALQLAGFALKLPLSVAPAWDVPAIGLSVLVEITGLAFVASSSPGWDRRQSPGTRSR